MSRLRSLFSSAVALEAMAPKLVDEELFPDELEHIRAAAPVRRAEFGTARVCARRALAALGLPPVSLAPRADRSPQWPAGVTGTISHTRDCCAVAVAKSPPVRALGLDIEVVRPLEPGVDAMILTQRELAFVRAAPRERRDELVILLFSAKEAYYKCQYPLTETFLGFHDVEVEMSPDESSFQASVRGAVSAPALVGKVAKGDRLVMCGVEAPW